MKHSKGFTLIELALVMVVIGLLTGGSMKLFSALSKRAKIIETRDKLQAISETIQGYGLNYKRLPTLEEFTKLFINAKDSWGKQIIYKVDPLLTQEGSLCKVKTSALKILQEGQEELNIAFTLVSSGANRNLQTGIKDHSIETTLRGAVEDFESSDRELKEPYDDFLLSYSLHRLHATNRCEQERLTIINQSFPKAYRNQSYQTTLFAQGGVAFESSDYQWCVKPKSQTLLNQLGIQLKPYLPSCEKSRETWSRAASVDLSSERIVRRKMGSFRLDFGVSDSYGTQAYQSLILDVER